MSPRKTRRGGKADGMNDTLSETLSKKSKENTPPPSQRTMRTRRQLSKTIAQDSEADQSLEVNKSRTKTVQETPSGKSTRSRKKALVENDNDLSNALDVTTGSKKRRTRTKASKILSEQTILDSSSINESKIEKPRATRGRKRLGKKENSKSEDESAEVETSKRNNVTTAKDSSIVENDHENVTTNDYELPMSKEDVEVQKASARNSRFRASSSTPSSPRLVGKRRGRNAKTKIEDFTPESSPITVNLSPHRTTKTPRKSPMNFGSPKSHAEQPLRLTKTPRKLPVVEESPAPSEISPDSSINGTPEKSSSARKRKLLDTSSARKNKRRTKSKSPATTPGKSPSKDLYTRKFAKSVKIVLKSPKRKSPKSKSPRLVTSKAKKSPISKRISKSPVKPRQSRSPNKSSRKSIAEITSPTSSNKSTESNRILHQSQIDSPSTATSPKTLKTSPGKQSKINEAQKSPTVLLNKISTCDPTTPETTRRSLSRRSVSSANDSLKRTPVKTASAEKRVSQGGESPRRSKSSVKKRTPITDSGTPLRPIASPRTSSSKASISKSVIISSSNNTPVESRATRRKLSDNAPILSSTPRERIRRSLNLSPGLGSNATIANTPINGPPVGSSTLIAETRVTRRSRIEDVTNPLISEDDESFSLTETLQRRENSRLDDTFEVARKSISNVEEEESKATDGTYELLEPKTPVLRRKAGKRSLAEIDASTEERASKRTCRVRFASSPPNVPHANNMIRGTSRSATPRQRVTEKRIVSGSSKVAAIETTANNSRRRSNSMTNVSFVKKTPISGAKRRSNSASEASAISAIKTAQNVSVNRLSKPRLLIHQANKKTDIKTPVARKAPNFAQIHEKKFANMESLVDAKKRVEKRHLAMNSQIPTSLSKVNTAARSKPKVLPKPPAPSVPVNGAYNRYGFKLRKSDALKIVSQKQQTHPSDKKQNENRLLLKGVRTNRRFDLIMKARNINQ